MEKYNFVVDSPIKLKDALLKNISGLSNFDIMKIMANKDIKINGKRTKENIMLNAGDEIDVFFKLPKFYEIVYEDKNIIVVNKVHSIETNSGDEQKQTLEKILRKEYPTVRAVHRLDTNTMGLICFALNDLAEKELKQAFKKGYVIKKYQAIVQATNVKNKESFVDYYEKDAKTAVMKVKSTGKTVQQIKLDYELLEKNDDIAKILVNLYTGKTHQIRAQLAYHKIYILGDGKYGDKEFNRKHKKTHQELKSVYLHFTNLDKLSYLESKIFNIQY